ncbi:MAG: hypothetical protein AB3N13_15555 [Arenibacterium sp.]
MNIVRSKPSSSHTVALGAAMSELNGPCVGCSDCNGLCAELIDALSVPDIILSKRRETQ